jgi:ribosome-binding protein aMBF1 (putative translation factor)
MGDAYEGPGRNLACHLGYGTTAPHRRGEGICEENTENAEARGRTGATKGYRRGRLKKRTTADELYQEWMKNPEYRREYAALEEEFSLTAALIEARCRAGLTQEQLAKRMNTTQGVIARLEGGGSKPSTRTLERYARATGSRLKISFEPVEIQ